MNLTTTESQNKIIENSNSDRLMNWLDGLDLSKANNRQAYFNTAFKNAHEKGLLEKAPETQELKNGQCSVPDNKINRIPHEYLKLVKWREELNCDKELKKHKIKITEASREYQQTLIDYLCYFTDMTDEEIKELELKVIDYMVSHKEQIKEWNTNTMMELLKKSKTLKSMNLEWARIEREYQYRYELTIECKKLLKEIKGRTS